MSIAEGYPVALLEELVANRRKIAIAVGTTLPEFATSLPSPSGAGAEAHLSFAEVSSIQPRSARRCCARLGEDSYCGRAIHLSSSHPTFKCLCKDHLIELIRLEKTKTDMTKRRDDLYAHQPTPLHAHWASSFLNATFWVMFLRQHIILCFFPPGTYGAASTSGHFRAIDFENERLQEVLRTLRADEAAAAVSESRFGVLAINDDDDDGEDNDGDWVADAECRLSRMDMGPKLQCIAVLQRTDDQIMEELREKFRVHVDDIRERVQTAWREIAPTDELLLTHADLDMADLARWFYLHAGALGWLDNIVSRRGKLRRLYTTENVKKILDTLIIRCIPTHAIRTVHAGMKAHGVAAMHAAIQRLDAANGYVLLCKPWNLLMPSELRHLLSSPSTRKELCDVLLRRNDDIGALARREKIDDAVPAIEALERDDVAFVFLDRQGKIAFAAGVAPHSILFGPASILVPAVAYDRFWCAFEALDPCKACQPCDLCGHDAALEAHLAAELARARWHLIAYAERREASHTCCAIVETSRVVLVIACFWNPYGDPDPLGRRDLRISSSISFEFGATMLREVAGVGHCRGHVVDRLVGGIDIETRRYTPASECHHNQTICLGPTLFFNKTARGIESARGVVDSLCGTRRSEPVYFASGVGVTLQTQEPPLRNPCELPDRSEFELLSQTAQIGWTRCMLDPSMRHGLHAEQLWRQASITLCGKTVQRADSGFTPCKPDIHLNRTRSDVLIGPNDRRERWDALIAAFAESRRRK